MVVPYSDVGLWLLKDFLCPCHISILEGLIETFLVSLTYLLCVKLSQIIWSENNMFMKTEISCKTRYFTNYGPFASCFQLVFILIEKTTIDLFMSRTHLEQLIVSLENLPKNLCPMDNCIIKKTTVICHNTFLQAISHGWGMCVLLTHFWCKTFRTKLMIVGAIRENC